MEKEVFLEFDVDHAPYVWGAGCPPDLDLQERYELACELSVATYEGNEHFVVADPDFLEELADLARLRAQEVSGYYHQ